MAAVKDTYLEKMLNTNPELSIQTFCNQVIIKEFKGSPHPSHFWNKLGCVFPMVISSDFRMGEHRDDDHEEDAPYFSSIEATIEKTEW